MGAFYKWIKQVMSGKNRCFNQGLRIYHALLRTSMDDDTPPRKTEGNPDAQNSVPPGWMTLRRTNRFPIPNGISAFHELDEPLSLPGMGD